MLAVMMIVVDGGDDKMTTGCPPKSDFQNASGPAVNPLNHQWPAPSQLDLDEPVSGNYYFWSFFFSFLLSKITPKEAHDDDIDPEKSSIRNIS